MQQSPCVWLAAVLATCASACAPTNLALPSGGPVPTATAAPLLATPQVPLESTTTVAVNSTDAYAIIAHAMLTCWFGGDGPLRISHVFHAEAAAAADGGGAEIVIHERDLAQRDQRGPRALRVAFASAPGGSRIAVAVIKAQPALAALMVRDVENWAKGGSECQMRSLYRQEAAAQAEQPLRATHR
jgi:hypothetical protein